MDRREFGMLSAAAATAAYDVRRATYDGKADTAQGGFALSEVSIAELQEQMTSGRTTSRRLVDAYTRRIADLDQRGPRLGHVLEVDDQDGVPGQILTREGIRRIVPRGEVGVGAPV